MKQEILRMLIEKRGNYLSGEEISRLLGVSRVAVWKQVNALRQEGYNIESSPKQGYRIVELPDILSKEEITIGLAGQDFIKEAAVFEQVSSTNDLAKAMAAQGSPEGTLVVADKQTKGKGRMGRSWESPSGKGLYFSLVLKPKIKPVHAPQLTLVAAVAVCRAIRGLTKLPVTIKWPNDILLEDKKVCGILTEMSSEIDQINYIVLGIGVNVNQGKDDFPENLRDKAISLAAAAGCLFRRVALLLEIVKELRTVYRLYQREGFAVIVESWIKMNSTLGREVFVSSHGEQYCGTAEGIDEQGRLLVRKGDGTLETLVAGDISLRGTH
ncbi:MAG: biotin--[acetyl-CoA-carboxylase] ligase [Peptococcaceae bacterium]|jgi:BirA family biotin operon repressor/biotin-[acetyl-CoA-carboxylase] ligase|nr:biotin--[acetyl-CoA-carboxylase] ligase [Peptococcaceae bacterium]MDH7524281.1 biotin--[acetyl-CoA-carboxylase] ligase [Peptococcaceae bacterium]